MHKPAVQRFALLNNVVLLQKLLQGEALLVEHELGGVGGGDWKRWRRSVKRGPVATWRNRGACALRGAKVELNNVDAHVAHGAHHGHDADATAAVPCDSIGDPVKHRGSLDASRVWLFHKTISDAPRWATFASDRDASIRLHKTHLHRRRLHQPWRPPKPDAAV